MRQCGRVHSINNNTWSATSTQQRSHAKGRWQGHLQQHFSVTVLLILLIYVTVNYMIVLWAPMFIAFSYVDCDCEPHTWQVCSVYTVKLLVFTHNTSPHNLVCTDIQTTRHSVRTELRAPAPGCWKITDTRGFPYWLVLSGVLSIKAGVHMCFSPSRLKLR